MLTRKQRKRNGIIKSSIFTRGSFLTEKLQYSQNTSLLSMHFLMTGNSDNQQRGVVVF